MDQLQLLDSSDFAMLLALSPAERLGGIIRLNLGARYRNRLDAFALLSALSDPPQADAQGRPDAASSPAFPDSSDSLRDPRGAGVVLASNRKQQQP